jgi:hypothetical protein
MDHTYSVVWNRLFYELTERAEFIVNNRTETTVSASQPYISSIMGAVHAGHQRGIHCREFVSGKGCDEVAITYS